MHLSIKVDRMDILNITLKYNIRNTNMAIKTLKAKVNGFSPLLQNNPRSINPMDPLGKIDSAAAKTFRSNKTDENFIDQCRAGIAVRIFWDDDLGIYVPTRWVTAALAKKAYSLLGKGYSKDAVRSAIFTITDKAKLTYDGMNNVKTEHDIIMNDKFQTLIFQKIGQVKVPKAMPIFHKWSFEFELEYDDSIFDFGQIKKVLEYTAKYGGYGDFRPTYGRALIEVIDE